MRWLILIWAALLGVPGSADVSRFLIGNAGDIRPEKLHGPAFHLQGGGTDVDAALQWMIDQVRGCADCAAKLDVVVIRASGDDGYNQYLYEMNGVDSVETLVIQTRNGALKPEIHRIVSSAEVVFFAGGDQCNYVRSLKGTGVESAVESVVKRGGGLGGTSAGVAILGDVTYDACRGSTRGYEGLADPYHESISFTYDFFHLPNLNATLTDQHLVERDRIGRTFAFLARQLRDKKMKRVLGLAIERETSLALDRNGIATVMGKGPAYFILVDHMPERCERGETLTYSGFKIWKVDAGGSYDLKNRPTGGYYARSVTAGVIEGDPYAETPCDYSALNGRMDQAQTRLALEALFQQCPNDLQPYRYLEDSGEPAFIREKAEDLRRLLYYSRTRDRLMYYGLLWKLERQTRSEASEIPERDSDLAEDVVRLEADPGFTGLEAAGVLQEGREYLKAANSFHR